MKMINFNNSYIKLPLHFYTGVIPTPVKNPKLICFNHNLACDLKLNLTDLDNYRLSNIFSGNEILNGSCSIAMVYAGHQFGHFVPQLGDGRTILLGEILDNHQERYDIQLKGSGKTPYSRRGDGRAALGPMIREYILSEAMHALKISTTRSLALVQTGEMVQREILYPGAILTRIAKSHIRIGTFEYFAAQKDLTSLKILADYSIQRHYPVIVNLENPYKEFLYAVMEKQISLIIDWMRVGFIHGVMNTDNMSISGETIDYGPCAFLDEYIPNKVFSSIDQNGRYAFSNQPMIALWNLLRLCESLSFLIEPDTQKFYKFIDEFQTLFIETYQKKYCEVMSHKIGILNPSTEEIQMVKNLFIIMERYQLDYTLTFQYLMHHLSSIAYSFDRMFDSCSELQSWIHDWKIHIKNKDIAAAIDLMSKNNPVFIPRNHIIEKIIGAAMEENDFSLLDKALIAFSKPYEFSSEVIGFMNAPTLNQKVHQTFCGT